MLHISTKIAATPEEYERQVRRLPQEYYDELERLAELDELKDKASNDH